MGKYKKRPIVVFLLILAALYVVIYILPDITGALNASYTAEYGELRVSDKTDGYLVRNEHVYFSVEAGDEHRLIKENKLVRKGTRIIELIQPDEDEKKNDPNDGQGLGTYVRFRDNIKGRKHIKTTDFVSLQEGIVSYHADGFESMLTPENMAKKDKSFFTKLSNNDNIDLARTKILATDPVFKICDRSRWYIVCYVPKESEKRYPEKARVRVEIDGKDMIVCKVESITDERREKKLIIRTDYYFERFPTLRKAEIEVITEDVMGLIISNTSIVKRNKQEGVFIRQKTGKYKFKPISVIATNGKESAIRAANFRDAEGNSVDTVRSHDDVLRRPGDDLE